MKGHIVSVAAHKVKHDENDDYDEINDEKYDDVEEHASSNDDNEKFALNFQKEYYTPNMVVRSELTFHEFELLGAALAEQTRDVDAENARWDAESPRRDPDEDTTGWAENDRGVPDTGVIYDWLWSDPDKDISRWNALTCLQELYTYGCIFWSNIDAALW